MENKQSMTNLLLFFQQTLTLYENKVTTQHHNHKRNSISKEQTFCRSSGRAQINSLHWIRVLTWCSATASAPCLMSCAKETESTRYFLEPAQEPALRELASDRADFGIVEILSRWCLNCGHLGFPQE